MMIFRPDQDQPVVMTDDEGIRYVDLGDDEVILVNDQDGEQVDTHRNWQLFVATGDLHTQACRQRHPGMCTMPGQSMVRYTPPCPGGVECAEGERARYRRELTSVAYAVAHPDVIV